MCLCERPVEDGPKVVAPYQRHGDNDDDNGDADEDADTRSRTYARNHFKTHPMPHNLFMADKCT